MPIIGRIDRIEQNKNTGAIRVLDYKSSTNGDVPAKKHWKRFACRDDAIPEYARFELAGGTCVVGPQLFIYAWALGEMERDDLDLDILTTTLELIRGGVNHAG